MAHLSPSVDRDRRPWLQPQNFGSIWHGGRQEIGILGNKSSIRQRSARSSPPRRRRKSQGVRVLTSYRLSISVHMFTKSYKFLYTTSFCLLQFIDHHQVTRLHSAYSLLNSHYHYHRQEILRSVVFVC